MARFGVGQWVDVEEFKGTVPWATLPTDLYSGQEALELQALVRPRLAPGDALLFDARVLHFGLPNRSDSDRAVLYCNLTEFWFRDPKNWDDEVSVFGERGPPDSAPAPTPGPPPPR